MLPLTDHQTYLVMALARMSAEDCKAVGDYLHGRATASGRREGKTTARNANMSIWLLHEYALLGPTSRLNNSNPHPDHPTVRDNY